MPWNINSQSHSTLKSKHKSEVHITGILEQRTQGPYGVRRQDNEGNEQNVETQDNEQMVQ